MRKVKVTEAVGLPLCHDITAIRDGFKGAAFRRGHVIQPEDVEALLNIGKQHVFIWEDTAGEIHEEDAALRLSKLAAVEHGSFSGPSEGKMVLTADIPGLFRVNTALLRAINSIGDITISTVPDHYPVQPGGRLASMRIVPLVTKESNITEAERLCAQSDTPLLQLLPYRAGLRAGIIITGSELYSGRVKDKFEPVARKKLDAYGVEIVSCRICDDDLDMLAKAIAELQALDVDLILLSGGMSVDPDDVTPTAVRNAGAEIVSHGVPSQPGNMLLVAYLGKAVVFGVPGAAVSLPVTTFDVMLPQAVAGVKITKADLVNLGDGGFCQGCKVCHWPNCTFGRY